MANVVGVNVSLLLNTCTAEPAVCPWDCEAVPDAFVGITDLFALVSQWTMANTSCDVDGGGVGITDLFDMFAHGGPCP